MANIFDLFKQIEKKPVVTGNIEYIVAGLGNPGREYERTRHNAGFMTLDYIAGRCGAEINRAKFSALVGEAEISGKRVLLLKPQTFMNLSGQAVAAAASFYKIPAEHIVVISDDISLDVGRMRVRRDGSHGGQNGLRNIESCLGSQKYPRIKMGIGGKPHPDYDLADWVLSPFSTADMGKLAERFPQAYEGLKLIIAGDIDGAMQECNGRS